MTIWYINNQICRAPLTGGVAKRSAKIRNNTYDKLFVNQNKIYANMLLLFFTARDFSARLEAIFKQTSKKKSGSENQSTVQFSDLCLTFLRTKWV
jgi:hypothetical protein